MKKHTGLLVNESREFDVSELFFSTTDRKGIIQSGNEVFIRVSGYEASELLGQPHNAIRHPHMPRAVFKLLWDYLLSNRPIGAYVKNLAKTGQYYWVFALVTPLPDGSFLSIRLKPTSPFLKTVEDLYKKALSHEESFGDNWKEGMQSSLNLIVQEISKLGFESYEDFMTEALRAELSSRAAILLDRADTSSFDVGTVSWSQSVFQNLDNLQVLKRALLKQSAFMNSLGSTVTRISLNSGIKATRLAEEGRALSTISTEISRVSGMISVESKVLSSQIGRLREAIFNASFYLSFAVLQKEMISFFAYEQRQHNRSSAEQVTRYGNDSTSLSKLLEEQIRLSIGKTQDAIIVLLSSLQAFSDVAESLRKILLTIQFSYVTGKTLAARVVDGDKFEVLLEELVQICEDGRVQIDMLNQSANEALASWKGVKINKVECFASYF